MEPLIIAILIGLITSIFNKVKESPSNKPVRQKPIQTASAPPSEPHARERERERDRPARSRVPREYKEPLKDAASSIQSRFEEKKQLMRICKRRKSVIPAGWKLIKPRQRRYGRKVQLSILISTRKMIS